MNMTPEQAWNLLVSATAEINTNRAGHDKIRRALEVLRPATPEPEADPEEPVED